MIKFICPECYRDDITAVDMSPDKVEDQIFKCFCGNEFKLKNAGWEQE
jgi:hypothetical protein